MAELWLPVSNETIERLERYRKFLWRLEKLQRSRLAPKDPREMGLREARIVNDVARMLNEYWGSSLRSVLKVVSVWGGSMKFL